MTSKNNRKSEIRPQERYDILRALMNPENPKFPRTVDQVSEMFGINKSLVIAVRDSATGSVVIEDSSVIMAPKVRACRVCGCTEKFGCPDGCFWMEEDLCSACTDLVSIEISIPRSLLNEMDKAIKDAGLPGRELFLRYAIRYHAQELSW